VLLSVSHVWFGNPDETLALVYEIVHHKLHISFFQRLFQTGKKEKEMVVLKVTFQRTGTA